MRNASNTPFNTKFIWNSYNLIGPMWILTNQKKCIEKYVLEGVLLAFLLIYCTINIEPQQLCLRKVMAILDQHTHKLKTFMLYWPFQLKSEIIYNPSSFTFIRLTSSNFDKKYKSRSTDITVHLLWPLSLQQCMCGLRFISFLRNISHIPCIVDIAKLACFIWSNGIS